MSCFRSCCPELTTFWATHLAAFSAQLIKTNYYLTVKSKVHPVCWMINIKWWNDKSKHCSNGVRSLDLSLKLERLQQVLRTSLRSIKVINYQLWSTPQPIAYQLDHKWLNKSNKANISCIFLIAVTSSFFYVSGSRPPLIGMQLTVRIVSALPRAGEGPVLSH